jgi:hypothetical protein
MDRNIMKIILSLFSRTCFSCSFQRKFFETWSELGLIHAAKPLYHFSPGALRLQRQCVRLASGSVRTSHNWSWQARFAHASLARTHGNEFLCAVIPKTTPLFTDRLEHHRTCKSRARRLLMCCNAMSDLVKRIRPDVTGAAGMRMFLWHGKNCCRFIKLWCVMQPIGGVCVSALMIAMMACFYTDSVQNLKCCKIAWIIWEKKHRHYSNEKVGITSAVETFPMNVSLKPHCIQSSRVLVPAGTSKSTLRRQGIQAVTRVMAYTLLMQWRCDVVFNNAYWRLCTSSESSTLKWLHRIQCGFKVP